MKDINSETEYEQLIRQLLTEDVLRGNNDLVLFTSKKAVDILICRNGAIPKAHFIEVKYHKNNHGRLGFGQGKGGGFQPEILLKRPHFFENNLRWILGSEDSEAFFFFDNASLIPFLQGGQVGNKFNGIQKRLFQEVPGLVGGVKRNVIKNTTTKKPENLNK